MAAPRWDITWDRGAAWRRTLVRKDLTGAVLGIGSPCLMELRGLDDPTTTPATLTLTGQITAGQAALTATRAQIEALPLTRYQHRILAVDLVSTLPVMLARGHVTIIDKVGG